MPTNLRRLASLALLALVTISLAAATPRAMAQDISSPAIPMDSPDDAEITRGEPKVVDGPNGSKVLRFDSPFVGSVDLGKLGINPHDYDLVKVMVKADRAAVLKFSLQNYPNPGDASYWWALDALRGPFDFKNIWLDLRSIESIKRSGEERAPWRAAATTPDTRLVFDGKIKDTGRAAQGDARSIWIGEIRLIKKAVDVDWDQSKFSHTGGAGEDLVYTYPLTLTNKLDRPITARLALLPFEVEHATARAPGAVELAAGETKTVDATVTLPADVASRVDPLYTERFMVRAWAQGIDHSDVTILRSSDPIHLVVTKPIAEERLALPLYPTPRELPGHLLYFDEDLARKMAEAAPVDELIQRAMDHGISNYNEKYDDSAFLQSLVASAYLYKLKGEKKYLQRAEALLAALPDIWDKHYAEWQSEPIRMVGAGIIARWNEGFHFTLGLGWRLAGTQRSPYQYSYDHNARGGAKSSIIYAFDMLSQDLKPQTRRRFIDDLLVPAGIHCRNMYIGDGNQQATSNAVVLYAGLASRNWPLVAFAYNAEHGLGGIMDWTFTDEGVHIRDGYQTYVMRPVFWMTELLYAVGVDAYTPYESRMRKIIGNGYGDQAFWQFVQQERF